ncbi:MAG: tRNA uridine-5-carboxymethylaminomethyl(34) synthesis GTPase MnmE [Candidatus Saganbacteria bacterium]|nr:tRNA uridine-5-carboxymethylaminomethyl(34) synthesis GTPase MnmE [Candidatus Saganbacteria bacterium]
MKHSLDDTIAAIATPAGAGGVGIVRISGKRAPHILKSIFCPEKDPGVFASHKLYHGWIVAGGKKLDEVLVSFMAAPHSYTGEDVAEVSCHGGQLVVSKVLEAVVEAGARLAERGEFTRRAFLNGRIDLIQAEAVIDLISARSPAALAAASAQLSGGLRAQLEPIRRRLVELLARLEGAVDFPEDLPGVDGPELSSLAGALQTEVDKLLARAEEGRIIREGVRVAIVGRPNVGKSSLLNCLAQEGRVIVSPLPGTTRDTIEEGVTIGGLPFVFIDTAGLRGAGDEVEKEGISRALSEAQKADLVLFLVDASVPLSTEDERVKSELKNNRLVVVFNKVDLGIKFPERYAGAHPVFKISVRTGAGLEQLKAGMVGAVLGENKLAETSRGVINTRHKECLFRVREALQKMAEGAANGMPQDLIAIDVRSGIIALGEVSGEQVSEEVIDLIFQNFCVGK